jgi:hypothetical protein
LYLRKATAVPENEDGLPMEMVLNAVRIIVPSHESLAARSFA